MSNRYRLKAYQSVYRDPQSVKINEVQRQRFQNAFNSDDMLAGTVDEMQAADFEGDLAEKMALEQRTRQQLEDRASRGDFETMGLDVAKSARSFAKDYAPIKDNKSKYDAYVKSVNEAYKDGRINAFTKSRSLDRSKFNYKGIQRNEDGTIDEGSYFGGYGFVNDVNIQEEMTAQMKDIAVRKYGNEGTVITKDGNFYITNGKDTESVLPDRVQSIFNNLMQDPDVAASVRQQGDLSTFDMTDEQIRENLVTDINGLEEAMQKAINDGDNELAAEYDATIKERQELLGPTGIESDPELQQERKNYALNSEINRNISRELKVSVDKFAFENVHTKYAEKYTELYVMKQKNILDNYTPNIFKKTEVSQVDNAGGDNVESINGYIGNQDMLIADEVQAVNEMAKAYLKDGQLITEQDIIDGNVPNEILEVLPGFKDRIVLARTQKYIQQNLMDRAYTETGFSVEGALEKQYGRYTGQELLDQAQKTLNDPTLTLPELITIREDLADLYGERSLLDPSSWNNKPDGFAATDPNDPNYERFQKALAIQRMFENPNSTKVITSLNSLKNSIEKDLDKANDWLKDNSDMTTGGMTSNNMPALSAEEVVSSTKYVNQYFTGNPKGGGKGLPLDKSFNIFYDGQKQSGTGTVSSFIKDRGWDSEDINVTQVFFDTTPYMGEPTLQLTVTGKKGDKVVSESIKMPYSNIKSEEMDNYFQAPGYRLQMELNMHKHTPGATNAPLAVYKDGKIASTMEVSFDPKRGDKVSVTENGKIKIYNVNSSEFSAFVNDAAKNGFDIRTRIQ